MSLRKSLSIAGRAVVLAWACVAMATGTASAGTLFTETFEYTIGANLAGQNGGSGFSGAWSGGTSTIVSGIGSSTSSVQINSVPSERNLSTTTTTSGTTTYLSYVMSATSFSGGKYTGISLYDGGTEQMFFGIPWQAQKFGFDARSDTGAAGIKTVNFTPSTNTSYLLVVGLLPSATSGKVDLAMWATSDLNSNPTTLVAGSPNASLIGVRNNFSFNQIRVAGDYSGALKVAGFAASPNVTEAVAVTVGTVVPEIDPAGMASVLALVTGALGLIERRRMALA